jgi:hypothetical protein
MQSFPAPRFRSTTVQTGAVYKTTSSSTGNYTLAQLPAGTYDLFVAMPALATYRKPDIVVQAGQKSRLDIQLDLRAPGLRSLRS